MKLLNKELTDAQRINHVLQAAIDHYPRLAAFKFSLQGANTDALFLPDKTTQHILNHPARSDIGAPASVLSFHAAVGHRLGNHVLTRIAAGKTSPPTLLRWVWGNWR